MTDRCPYRDRTFGQRDVTQREDNAEAKERGIYKERDA